MEGSDEEEIAEETIISPSIIENAHAVEPMVIFSAQEYKTINPNRLNANPDPKHFSYKVLGLLSWGVLVFCFAGLVMAPRLLKMRQLTSMSRSCQSMFGPGGTAIFTQIISDFIDKDVASKIKKAPPERNNVIGGNFFSQAELISIDDR